MSYSLKLSRSPAVSYKEVYLRHLQILPGSQEWRLDPIRFSSTVDHQTLHRPPPLHFESQVSVHHLLRFVIHRFYQGEDWISSCSTVFHREVQVRHLQSIPWFVCIIGLIGTWWMSTFDLHHLLLFSWRKATRVLFQLIITDKAKTRGGGGKVSVLWKTKS